MVHPRGDGGAIVEQHELSCELFRVTRAGLFGELVEQRPKPATVALRNLLDAASLGRLGAGSRERAPMETGVLEHQTLYVEDPEKSLPGSLVASDKLSRDAFADCLVTSSEICANEPILIPEQRVQRCLGDTSSLDDAVDANGVHPFLVEERIGRIEQSLARRCRLGILIHRHALTI